MTELLNASSAPMCTSDAASSAASSRLYNGKRCVSVVCGRGLKSEVCRVCTRPRTVVLSLWALIVDVCYGCSCMLLQCACGPSRM